jgi:DNA-binding GntR family transcriptional regulator
MFQRFKSAIERFYQPPPVHRLMQDQLYEAERQDLEHTAASEHHEALAMMYRGRAERLRELLGYDVKPLTGKGHLHFSDDLKGFKWKDGAK